MENQRIPKIIHYVWPGRDEKKGLSKICIQSWKDVLPEDWEIKEWNFDTFDFEGHKLKNKFFREVCERNLFAFIADYVRAVVLYEYGGIYLDTDVTLLKPFDEKMLSQRMILAIQNERLVEPAIWGAEKHHEFTKTILDFYNDEIWNCKEYIMPDVFAKHLREKYNINEFEVKEKQEIFSTGDNAITFYPEKYFIPYRYQGQYLPTCVEPETTTIHWFRGSWCNNDKLSFLKNKYKTPKKELTFLQKIFSVTNTKNKEGKNYKQIMFLGMKIKYRKEK